LECCAGTFILQDRTIFLCTFLKNEKNERGFKKSVTLTFWTAPLQNGSSFSVGVCLYICAFAGKRPAPSFYIH
ncbi:hypothetical protein, partial [Anoxybacteroides rupiense]|uniref:hypothetical protein n=1 Tax=Anoxybacteroides rupiense TaxID=311460 RepID=UPI003FA59D64